MRKFLSVLMALTILIVPFGTNRCMASGDTSDGNAVQLEIAELKDTESMAIPSKDDNKPATSKKSSYKLLITSLLVAAVCAGVFALNKIGVEGQVGKFLGKTVGSAGAFMSAGKDSIAAYIEKIPVLKSIFDNTKALFVTKKGNMVVDSSTFEEAFDLNPTATASALSSTNEAITPLSSISTPIKSTALAPAITTASIPALIKSMVPTSAPGITTPSIPAPIKSTALAPVAMTPSFSAPIKPTALTSDPALAPGIPTPTLLRIVPNKTLPPIPTPAPAPATPSPSIPAPIKSMVPTPAPGITTPSIPEYIQDRVLVLARAWAA